MKKAIFLSILLFIVGCDKIYKQENNMTISVPTTIDIDNVITNVTESIQAYSATAAYVIGDEVRIGDEIHEISSYPASAPMTFDEIADVNAGDIYLYENKLYEAQWNFSIFPIAENTDTVQPTVNIPDGSGGGYFYGETYRTKWLNVKVGDWDRVPLFDGFTLIDMGTRTIVSLSTTSYTTEVVYDDPSNPTTQHTWTLTPFSNDMDYFEEFLYNGSIYNVIYNYPTYGPYVCYPPDANLSSYPNMWKQIEFNTVYKSPVNNLKPFDGKNYTTAKATTTMTYTVKGITNKFDTLALGRIKADSVDIIFKDPLGVQVGPTISKTLDTTRDPDGNLEGWYTTDISYSSAIMDPNSTVEIEITGDSIELGSILLGMSVDAGFTKLNLQNSYIDYSVAEENQFGFIDYVERGKVAVYDGLCDVFVTDYDRIDRLMTSLGAQLIILNGSDKKNTVPDGQSVFAATQKIGRLFNFKQQTKLDGKRLHQMATYSFTLKATI